MFVWSKAFNHLLVVFNANHFIGSGIVNIKTRSARICGDSACTKIRKIKPVPRRIRSRIFLKHCSDTQNFHELISAWMIGLRHRCQYLKNVAVGKRLFINAFVLGKAVLGKSRDIRTLIRFGCPKHVDLYLLHITDRRIRYLIFARSRISRNACSECVLDLRCRPSINQSRRKRNFFRFVNIKIKFACLETYTHNREVCGYVVRFGYHRFTFLRSSCRRCVGVRHRNDYGCLICVCAHCARSTYRLFSHIRFHIAVRCLFCRLPTVGIVTLTF